MLYILIFSLFSISLPVLIVLRGVSRIFERGGPISLGSLKGHQIFERGGVQWSDGGGGPVHKSH